MTRDNRQRALLARDPSSTYDFGIQFAFGIAVDNVFSCEPAGSVA